MKINFLSHIFAVHLILPFRFYAFQYSIFNNSCKSNFRFDSVVSNLRYHCLKFRYHCLKFKSGAHSTCAPPIIILPCSFLADLPAGHSKSTKCDSTWAEAQKLISMDYLVHLYNPALHHAITLLQMSFLPLKKLPQLMMLPQQMMLPRSLPQLHHPQLPCQPDMLR